MARWFNVRTVHTEHPAPKPGRQLTTVSNPGSRGSDAFGFHGHLCSWAHTHTDIYTQIIKV